MLEYSRATLLCCCAQIPRCTMCHPEGMDRNLGLSQ
jgi:hypothetical protein